MAAKKKDKKAADKDAAAAASLAGKKGGKWQFYLLAIAFLACCLAFLPTTLLLFFGLMPTFAALVIDPTPDKIKTLAVGAMNLSGIVPFLLKLWTGGEATSIESAFRIVAQPETMITMYGTAAIGYFIFYSVSSFVATVLLQRARVRVEDIRKRMTELERKWGREVTGVGSLNEEEEDFLSTENK